MSPRGVGGAAFGGIILVVATGVSLLLAPSSHLLVGGLDASTPVWSPTGDHLAFLVHDSLGLHVAVYDFARRAHRVIGDTPAEDASGFSWSPDGRQIAYAGPDVTGDGRDVIHVYDIATQAYRPLAAGSSPHWRGDGSILAVCGPERPPFGEDADDTDGIHEREPPGDTATRFCRIDAETGEASRTPLAFEPGMILSPLLDRVLVERETPDGGQLFVASVNTGDVVRVPAPPGFAAASWTPAGDRVVLTAPGASGLDVWTLRDDGTGARRVLASANVPDPQSVRLSADGSLVFFVAPVEGGSDLHAARAGDGAPIRVTGRHPYKSRYDVSPDGQSIAYEVLTRVRKPGGPGKREIWLMAFDWPPRRD